MSTPAPPDYPPPIVDLLEEESPTAARRQLEVFDFTSAVAPRPVQDASMAEACESGLWLRHQFLDESHQVSQQIDTPTGSYWHGIMHRREGDFLNSHYWFNKVGEHHPVLAMIDDYDPHSFIDEVERRHGTQSQELVTMQRREWQTLFEWCAREAEARQ